MENGWRKTTWEQDDLGLMEDDLRVMEDGETDDLGAMEDDLELMPLDTH